MEINEILMWISLLVTVVLGIWIVLGSTPPTESIILSLLVAAFIAVYSTNNKVAKHAIESKYRQDTTNNSLGEIKHTLTQILDELKKR